MYFVLDMNLSEVFQFDTREELDGFIIDEFADDTGVIDEADLENVWIIEGKEVDLGL